MVMRRKTGWEHLRDEPVAFFENVLLMQLTNMQKAQLNAIADGRRDRLGLVWNPDDEPTIDEAAMAVGVAMWRAACWHRPTVLWGGRPTIASAWLVHAVMILTASRPEFRSDFRLVREGDKRPWGLVMPNGCWVIRYDGPLAEDCLDAAHKLGNRADVLMGDVDWMDRTTIQDALDYADREEALVTLVMGQHA